MYQNTTDDTSMGTVYTQCRHDSVATARNQQKFVQPYTVIRAEASRV